MRSRSLFRPASSGLSLLRILVLAVGLTCTEAGASGLDILLFGSLDGGAGTFVSAGAKIASGSLSEEGPVALLIAGGGVRSERIGCDCGWNHTLSHETTFIAGSLGYQWVIPEGVVAGFVGGEAVLDTFGALALTVRQGLRVQAEAWLRPTEETLVAATLVAGTARGDGWARIAWGRRLWDAYLGPEGSAYLDATGYRKLATGVHATDIAIADLRLRISGGLQWETGRRRTSPYFAVSAWAPW